LVVITGYRPRARWRPRPISPGEAALALFSNTVAARRQPKFAFDTLAQVVSRAQAFKGARGEAEEVVDYVSDKSRGGFQYLRPEVAGAHQRR